MRKLAILIFLCMPFIIFGQHVEKLEIQPNGINGILEHNFKNKSASEIYTSIKNWANKNVHNVYIGKKGDIKNEYLSFKIIRTGEVTHDQHEEWRWNLDLSVKITIQDNKILTNVEILGIPGVEDTQDLYIKGGHISLFNNKGEERESYASVRESLNEELNKFCNEIFLTIEKHSGKVRQG